MQPIETRRKPAAARNITPERALCVPGFDRGGGVSVDSVGAVLLISDDAAGLAAFYRDALGLPLEDEVHEGVPLHYGCELGSVHFAIHPSADWPGERSADGQSPVIVLHTGDVQGAY